MIKTKFAFPYFVSLRRASLPAALVISLVAGLPALAQTTVSTPITPAIAPASASSAQAPVPAATQASPASATLTSDKADASVPAAPAVTSAPSASLVPTHAVEPALSTEPVPVAATPKSGPSLSPWSMFLAADGVVKAIICILLAASLATWTVFFAKTSELARERRRLTEALAILGEARSLAEVRDTRQFRMSVVADLVRAAQHELRLSDGSPSAAGIKERLATRLQEAEIAESRSIRAGTGVLATIGSIGPFVGLLGTVWGIMNSFIGISQSGTTNLAVVAPGIAEALLATAIGLFAAIPAVAVYNHFSRATTRHLDLVSRASGEIARLVSRDLDRQSTGRPVAVGLLTSSAAAE